MKKLKLLFFVLGLPVVGMTQVFAPVGATWHYSQTFAINGDTSFVKIESTGDTIISGNNCRILTGSIGTCSDEGNRNYFWNDSNRIYFYKEGIFKLLYDFNSNAGDEWEVVIDYFGNNDTILIHVDSISYETYNSVQLKVLHVNMFSDIFGYVPVSSNKIIERIGDTHYLFPWLNAVCDNNFGGPLRCYEDSLITVFFPNVSPTCEYITDVETFFINKNKFNVYPNPRMDKTNITLTYDLECTSFYELINAFGGIITLGKIENNNKSLEIDLSSIQSGLYYLKLVDCDNNLITFKLIVS